MVGAHVTSAELLPVIRKALPSQSEFSDTVAHNIAFAVSTYLSGRNALTEPSNISGGTGARAQHDGGHRQSQRVATPPDLASGHTVVATSRDANGHVTMKVSARPFALTSVHYWVDPGGRGHINTESARESKWTGGDYATAEKLAAEHGLHTQRVVGGGVTTWTRV